MTGALSIEQAHMTWSKPDSSLGVHVVVFQYVYIYIFTYIHIYTQIYIHSMYVHIGGVLSSLRSGRGRGSKRLFARHDLLKHTWFGLYRDDGRECTRNGED